MRPVKIIKHIYIRKGPGRAFAPIGDVMPSGNVINMEGTEPGENYKDFSNWYYRTNDNGVKQYYWGGGVEEIEQKKNVEVEPVQETENAQSDTVLRTNNILFDYNNLLKNLNPEWDNKPLENLTVVIIDTGVNIGKAILNSFSEIDLTAGTSSDKDHGTFICGIINTIDEKIIGAKKNLSILSIRYKDENTDVEPMLINLKKALDDVIKLKSNNPQKKYIVNISQGFRPNQIKNHKSLCDDITKALNTLSSLKVIILSAAGENTDLLETNLFFPAMLPSTISIGCINEQNSNIAISKSIDIVTPIYRFILIDSNHKTTDDIGSSFSTAFCSAIAASIISLNNKDYTTADLLNEINPFSTEVFNFDFNSFSSFQFTIK